MECFSYLRNVEDLLFDGKTPHERRFGATVEENRSFSLVHLLSITLFSRKTSQESINLVRKSYLDFSSDTLCTLGEFGSMTNSLETLRSGRRWTHLKYTRKDSIKIFQFQMDESNLLEEITT